jgi:Outer membrane protein beta-barrel domain
LNKYYPDPIKIVALVNNRLPLKRAFLFLIIVAAIKTTSAQVRLGVKAGVNIANIILTSPQQGIDKFTPITAFNGGMLVSIKLRGHFYLQPELMFSGQGGTLNGVEEHNVYFNIPILFKYQSPNGLFAEAGMQPGVIISNNQPLVSNEGRVQQSPLDGCWVFGAGYQIPKINLGVDIRYNIGMMPFYVVNGQNINGRNSVIQFDLFYIFPRKI